MHLEDTAGADHKAMGGVALMDLPEVVTDQVEGATVLVMEEEEYQWARWRPEWVLG